jgi:hypothetical protein
VAQATPPSSQQSSNLAKTLRSCRLTFQPPVKVDQFYITTSALKLRVVLSRPILRATFCTSQSAKSSQSKTLDVAFPELGTLYRRCDDGENGAPSHGRGMRHIIHGYSALLGSNTSGRHCKLYENLSQVIHGESSHTDISSWKYAQKCTRLEEAGKLLLLIPIAGSSSGTCELTKCVPRWQ